MHVRQEVDAEECGVKRMLITCQTTLPKALRLFVCAGEQIRRKAGRKARASDNDRRWSTKQVETSENKCVRTRGEFVKKCGAVKSKQQTIPLHLHDCRSAKMQMRVIV